jgi:tRNA dimethylallyltransferase
VKKAVLIVGPTASGKSRLALECAVATQIPILNVDSIQMCKGLKIGAALPSSQDFKLADHFLYSFVEKGQQITAAIYVNAVQSLLQKNDFQRLLFCGGSGFYLQALEKGMYPVSKATAQITQQIDQRVVDEGWVKLHQWLIEKSPQLQRTIHRNDHYRIRRALEMMMLSQKNPEELEQNLTPSPIVEYKKMKVGLFAEKEVLRARVEHRAQAMLEEGFVEEVQALRQKYSDWAPLSSVGYKEVGLYLDQQISKDELLPSIVTSHMQLIKKQLTWFKKDESIKWFHVDHLAKAKKFVLEWL